MDAKRVIEAHIVSLTATQLIPRFRPPDWLPLERALAAEFGVPAIGARNAFWFIGFVDGPADVGELRMYQHSVTRRELALDTEGRAYKKHADADTFSPMPVEQALVDALS